MTTDLINRSQAETPSENRTIEEIAQLSKDQDAKTKDHVGRVQSVLDNFGCEIVMTPSSRPRHSQTHSHAITINESLDSKLRDETKTTR